MLSILFPQRDMTRITLRIKGRKKFPIMTEQQRQ